MTDKVRALTIDELCGVLDKLQEGMETTPYLEEEQVLRGSYGVYLYQLRHQDAQLASLYVDWMHDYKERTGL